VVSARSEGRRAAASGAVSWHLLGTREAGILESDFKAKVTSMAEIAFEDPRTVFKPSDRLVEDLEMLLWETDGARPRP